MAQTTDYNLQLIESTDTIDYRVLNDNIRRIITALKELTDGKLSAESGKGLSTNDYTNEEKEKLSKIENEANKYIHPTQAQQVTSFRKIGNDTLGHVVLGDPVIKEDITRLGIPAQDTTYGIMNGATTAVAGSSGLVPAPSTGAAYRVLTSAGTWVDGRPNWNETNSSSLSYIQNKPTLITQSTIDTINSTITGLQNTITALEARIAALETAATTT